MSKQRDGEDYYDFCMRLEREKLRDEFAKAALTGLLAGPDYAASAISEKDNAAWAYKLADAMLKAREPKP